MPISILDHLSDMYGIIVIFYLYLPRYVSSTVMDISNIIHTYSIIQGEPYSDCPKVSPITIYDSIEAQI